jgi:hypothetical protein
MPVQYLALAFQLAARTRGIWHKHCEAGAEVGYVGGGLRRASQEICRCFAGSVA